MIKWARSLRGIPSGNRGDLFDMANLFPRTTGLPMTAWIGPRGNVRHDVRLKINVNHDDQ